MGKHGCNIRLLILNSYQEEIHWAFPVNFARLNATRPHGWCVNIGLGSAWLGAVKHVHLSQCWSSSMLPCGVTMTQWVIKGGPDLLVRASCCARDIHNCEPMTTRFNTTLHLHKARRVEWRSAYNMYLGENRRIHCIISYCIPLLQMSTTIHIHH